VILAAGRGDPADVTGIVEVSGADRRPHRFRASDGMLRACGIETIAVVAGFRADDVARLWSEDRSRRQPPVRIDQQFHSLWLARDLLSDGFVSQDVLFRSAVVGSADGARRMRC
jgi:hypothetical protein